MNINKVSKSAFKSFLKDSTGTVAIMYALVIVPLFLCSGAAIDMVRFNAAQTHLQSSLDSGALAGAGTGVKTNGDRLAAAQALFDANMKEGAAAGYETSASFDIQGGVVLAEATVKVPMAFMQLAGIDTMDAIGKAEVGLAKDKKAEIVMVLDYSGSMGEVSGSQVKYVAMKDAATALVNDLAAASADKVKFGLVPFSHHVYTTLPKSYVLGATGGGNWTGCTQDRQFPFNTSADTPTSAVGSKWNQTQAAEHKAWGCKGYTDNNLKTVDLTNKFSSITGQLAIMKPYAWTHIAVGVEFGYQMLSPNAPFTQGVSFGDADTQKFMVVLTDGEQTEPGFGPSGIRTVSQGENNLEALCASAKKDGITIITMAFDLNDTTTRKRLKNCSTDPKKHFFIADDATDLANAFDAVKEAITAQVYLSK